MQQVGNHMNANRVSPQGRAVNHLALPLRVKACHSPLPHFLPGVLRSHNAERRWQGKYQLRAELQQVTDRTGDGGAPGHTPPPHPQPRLRQ